MSASLAVSTWLLVGCAAPDPVETGCVAADIGDSVQNRVDAACPGDVVEIPAGTWHGNVVIRAPLTLRGAGADQTILDGLQDDSVVIVAPEAEAVRLEGLTITGGTTGSCWGDEDGCYMAGGGLSVTAPTTLADVRITGNTARDAGGGVLVGWGYTPEGGLGRGYLVTERDVVIDGNTAKWGYAVDVLSGDMDLAGASIFDNHAATDTADWGRTAAVQVGAGTTTLRSTTRIVDNVGGGCGGLSVEGATVIVEGAQISGNTGVTASGACLYDVGYGPGTLTSIGADWGDAEAIDIDVDGVGTYTYGADASFTCTTEGDAAGCEP